MKSLGFVSEWYIVKILEFWWGGGGGGDILLETGGQRGGMGWGTVGGTKY